MAKNSRTRNQTRELPPVAQQIADRLEAARRVAVFWHEHPDGDCVGSALALCAVLRALGHQACAFSYGSYPARYRFLNRGRLVRAATTATQLNADAAVVVDTTSLERTGGLTRLRLGRCPLLVIDHHISNECFGDLNWVEEEAAAAGEMIHRLVTARSWPLPPAARQALYTAILTDTGQFAYSNTTSYALRMAADLLDAGVEPQALWRHIYLNKTPGEVELEARARESLQVWGHGRIAVIALEQEDFTATKTTFEAAQEFPSIPRSLAGVKLALFFYAVDHGAATKLSIRSLRQINACALAQRFGGGGHRQAAGCRIAAPLRDAIARFRPAAEEAVAAARAADTSSSRGS